MDFNREHWIDRTEFDTKVKDIRRHFAEHVAVWNRLDDRIEHLWYHRPGTCCYAMNAVFDDFAKTMTISGDLGCALIVAPTWDCHLWHFHSNDLISLDYFEEKIACTDRDRWQHHLAWAVALHDAAHEVADRILKTQTAKGK